MSHVAKYFDQAKQITAKIDYQVIESMAESLAALREKGGRLFFIGVGGSAGICANSLANKSSRTFSRHQRSKK